MSEKIKVRWIISHFPRELFYRTANEFKNLIEKTCPDQFEFEIHSIPSYVKQYEHLFSKEELDLFYSSTPEIAGLEEPSRTQDMVGPNGVDPVVPAKSFERNNTFWTMMFNKLGAGAYEMTQNQVNIIGNYLDRRYHAVDLPFLWKSHDHVSEALDGAIGDNLGKGLTERSNIQGLAFTYSGGYRIIGSSKEIASLNDLQNQDIVTATAPSNRFFTTAGIKTTKRIDITVDDLDRMTVEGGAIETTYLRFGGKYVLKTNHSMFTTSILANQDFLNKLTNTQRKAFLAAAKIVAKKERVWSVEDAAKYETDAEARGIKINPIPEAEEQLLRDAANTAFSNVKTLEKLGIDPSVVDEIIKIGQKY